VALFAIRVTGNRKIPEARNHGFMALKRRRSDYANIIFIGEAMT
jgi:hypothetical protein